MKAQFFILGAILLCSLFFVGLPASRTVYHVQAKDIDYLADNLDRELPHALNLGLSEGVPVQAMENFTGWVRDLTRGMLVDFSAVWIFTDTDQSSGNVTVVAGNYMGNPVTIHVELDGDQRELVIPDGSSASTTFGSVADSYDIDLAFGTEARSFSWNRDKVNLFALAEMQRDDDVIRKEISA